MSEKNRDADYNRLAETMQKIANEITRNFQLNNILPQMKAIQDTMSNLRTFPISEEVKAFIFEAKASENLSHEDFLNKYGEEIDICKTVGKAGWVVSEHSNPREIKEWYQLIVQGKDAEIIEYFDADNSNSLRSIRSGLSKSYVEAPSCRYYNKGIEAYDKEDYMTAAMYLVALLESRTNDYMNYPRKMSYSKKYSEDGFEQHLKKVFVKTDSVFTKRFLFLDMYPSLIEFLNRLFVDGIYTLDSKNEPPYINRNWLLHGKCTRNIERFECVQLLNALSVIEFVFKMA